jgi:two-component system response regulator AtoC
MNASILVIDDDRAFRLLAEEALVAGGFEVRISGTLARGLAAINDAMPDVVIVNRCLPDGDGIDVIQMLRSEGAIVLVAAASGDVENAREALRAGAWDYLTKPVRLADLIVRVHKALATRGLKDRLRAARSNRAGAPAVAPTSRSMREIIDVLTRVAESPLTPMLLAGPSGSGKQHTAELLHELTFAKGVEDAPFMQVNCAALPEDVLENELFGHEKGAFLDAKETQRGLIDLAAGGTLFIDEVTAMPLGSQAKLLKFLDKMRFRRLGGEREIAAQLRVVAATTSDIRDRVRRGAFREDLYHRLTVFAVELPPLVERKEDIPDLAAAFVRWFSQRIKKRISGIAADALEALEAYGYPGNVRELRNIIERAVILSRGPTLVAWDLIFPPGDPARKLRPGFFTVELRGDGTPPRIDEIGRNYVGRVLEHSIGHRKAAAQALGLSYPTFLKRLRELGLD